MDWRNYRIRNAYCTCVYTHDLDVALKTTPDIEASIKNVKFENTCPRHASLNLSPGQLEAFIRSESVVVNKVHGLLVSKYPDLDIAEGFFIDDQGVIKLPTATLPTIDKKLQQSINSLGVELV